MECDLAIRKYTVYDQHEYDGSTHILTYIGFADRLYNLWCTNDTNVTRHHAESYDNILHQLGYQNYVVYRKFNGNFNGKLVKGYEQWIHRIKGETLYQPPCNEYPINAWKTYEHGK